MVKIGAGKDCALHSADQVEASAMVTLSEMRKLEEDRWAAWQE